MIVNRVSRLMGERRESITDLAQGAGIAYGTAYALYHGSGKGIEYETLDKLCRHFGVGPGEILEYVSSNTGQFENDPATSIIRADS